ncbi:MAG: hypothetical protein ABI651_13950 [Verrucomicrobiota bacterium]
MAALSDRERRTIRIGGTAIAIYLVLFFGLRAWKALETRRSDYQKLVKDAQSLREEFRPYENRALLVEKLRETFRIDPPKLSKATIVAEASAAIQKTATTGGVQLGPIRESAARPSAKELASMQLEGSGPVAALLTFLHRLETLGYPLILDSVQISSDPTRPGMIKLNLTIIILDFEQWKNEGTHNA